MKKIVVMLAMMGFAGTIIANTPPNKSRITGSYYYRHRRHHHRRYYHDYNHVQYLDHR